MDFIGIDTFTVEGSLDGQAMKVLEEANELFAECHRPESEVDVDRVLSEAVDTVTAVANLLTLMRIAQGTVDDAVMDCNTRNAERGRLGYAIKMDGGHLANASFGSQGILARVADDSKYALRFDNRENAQLMADLLYNLGIEADVVPYAANA